jgi:hypothetical protein
LENQFCSELGPAHRYSAGRIIVLTTPAPVRTAAVTCNGAVGRPRQLLVRCRHVSSTRRACSWRPVSHRRVVGPWETSSLLFLRHPPSDTTPLCSFAATPLSSERSLLSDRAIAPPATSCLPRATTSSTTATPLNSSARAVHHLLPLPSTATHTGHSDRSPGLPSPPRPPPELNATPRPPSRCPPPTSSPANHRQLPTARLRRRGRPLSMSPNLPNSSNPSSPTPVMLLTPSPPAPGLQLAAPWTMPPLSQQCAGPVLFGPARGWPI